MAKKRLPLEDDPAFLNLNNDLIGGIWEQDFEYDDEDEAWEDEFEEDDEDE